MRLPCLSARALALLPLLAMASLPAAAQSAAKAEPSKLPPPTTKQIFPADPNASVPKVASLQGNTPSELADVVDRFSADQTALNRRYDASDSPAQRTRMRAFYAAWEARLKEHDFDKLSQEGRVDYVLLDNEIKYALQLLKREDKQRAETANLLPFMDRLLAMQDARRNLESLDPAAAARTLATVTKQIDSLRARVDATPASRGRDSTSGAARTIANRAADDIDALKASMGAWNRFYTGYDPMFTWWMASPYQQFDQALTRYAASIRTRLVGLPAAGGGGGAGGAAAAVAQGGGGGRGGAGGPGGGGGGAPGGGGANASSAGPIIGDPVGAEGLAEDLKNAMIPYTPQELIAIAEREYAFSLSEAKKAAREMGFGDDWKAAMEKVKNTYVEPGKQPDLIRDLARQAEAFFDQHDWVTIPALAREDWRMEMLSPERQRTSPFFLGGESILVSYPTADMSDEDKLMSLRGNNPHFSHATVFHELNPGHHLQGFMTARYNTHRRLFSTPFWNEGQSLYWEMFLWDRDFHVSPEDRMGALFWRMHRSARIVFSFNFHLGNWTPERAIDYLVDTVAFERANAEAEVRRSFNGSYAPIYQAAYMLGGLQLRALYAELVDTKKMTDRQFHDAILQGGPMPIAMVRARLAKIPLTRDGAAPWRFADKLPPPRPFPVKTRAMQ